MLDMQGAGSAVWLPEVAGAGLGWSAANPNKAICCHRAVGRASKGDVRRVQEPGSGTSLAFGYSEATCWKVMRPRYLKGRHGPGVASCANRHTL